MNPQLQPKFDQMFLTICQEAGGLNPFLEAMFSFLQRRTDFYYEAEPGDPQGFPPGYPEQLIYSFFKKYQDEHEKKVPSKGEALRKRWEEFKKKAEQAAEVKKAQRKAAEASSASKPQTGATVEEVKDDKPSASEASEAQAPKLVSAQAATQPSAAAQAQSQPVQAQASSAASAQAQQEEGKESSVDKSISTYNGAATKKYNWSQTVFNVDVQIPLPKGTTARDLLVVIKQKHLKVQLKSADSPIIDGELCERIKTEETFWNVEEKQFLNINFEKADERIWKTIIVGDDEIDTKTVDNAKRIDEFDLETQGHLQKVMYEQERKRMGLPTTDEEKQQKLMAEIMAKQGADAPNAGLPFDPNLYRRTDGSNAPTIPFAN